MDGMVGTTGGAANEGSLVQQVLLGFETLQEEYKKLFSQHQSLERKLATAREQVSPPMRLRYLRPFYDHCYDEKI
jgi:hypothetical protein